MQSAVLSNSIDQMRAVVNKSNVDVVDSEGYTPLFYACMKPSVSSAMVQAILDLGANLDVTGQDRETALYIAVFNRRMDICHLLLQRGAAVDKPNGPLQETVLHLAARLDYEDIVAVLLTAKADKNVRNAKLETPLYAAAKMGHHRPVYRLLEAGANAAIGNEDHKTPLYIASEKGYKHVVIILKANLQEMKFAMAAANAEIKSHPTPMSSTDSIINRAKVDDVYRGSVRQRAMVPVSAPSTSPINVVDIHVPSPKIPLQGGPCKSLEEAGYQGPPPIPAELQGRPPAKLPRVGGTTMMVMTEEGSRVPPRVDISADSSMEFFVPPNKMTMRGWPADEDRAADLHVI